MGYLGRKFSFPKVSTHMFTVHSSGTMMKVTGVLFFIRINRLEQTFYTSPLSIQQPCWCLSLSGSLVINDKKTWNIKSTAILQQWPEVKIRKVQFLLTPPSSLLLAGKIVKAREKPPLWRPGMNTVSIQTPGLGWKRRRQQKRWRCRWPFLLYKNHTLLCKTRLPTGNNMEQMVLTWIWSLELGINRSDRWEIFCPTSFFPLSNLPDSFLLTGSWRQHVLLHKETSQLSSWLHHYPANLWLSSGGLHLWMVFWTNCS